MPPWLVSGTEGVMHESPRASRGSQLVVSAGIALMAIVALAGGMVDPPRAASGSVSPSSKPLPPELFQGWPEQPPEVAIVLSGQQHSYLKFCGCSQPQQGGFERRYNFLAKL